MGERGAILQADFYNRKTETVARELLGKTLVHELRAGKKTVRLSGRIVEVEAYLGAKDLAAHSSGGKVTPRTRTMYMGAGHAYVYLIYGLHFCLNVVTREPGEPQAILIRAIEPVEGVEVMRAKRPSAKKDRDLTSGPGKVCAALGLDKSFDASLMTAPPLYIEDAPKIKKSHVLTSPRIGVDYAGEHALWPLRFSISGNPYVSKPQPQREA